MRILVVAPWVPTTRRPRSRQFISLLGRQHEVRVLAAAWSRAEALEGGEVPALTEIVRLSRIAALFRVVLAVFSGRSLQQAYVSSNRFTRRLRKLEEELDPDVVIFNVVRSAHMVDHLRADQAIRILDMDEFRSSYYAQVQARSTSAWQRLVASLETRRMAAAEERAIDSYDSCIVSSPRDLRSDIPRVRLVRSAHLLSQTDGLCSGQGSERILFVGRMSYSANEEAVLWFIREVWPLVSERRPNATFDIVGESPSKRVMALANDRVHVRGSVVSVDEYYRRAAVSVVPISMATGVQMKLIEALAAGTPTVITPLVASLAGISDGRECAVASEPEEWANAIDTLLDDPDHALSIARRGHLWLNQNHGLSAVEEQLSCAITESGAPWV